MMQDPLDLAQLVARSMVQLTGGEALASRPTLTSGLVPTQSTFVVETVEGRAFRVIVTED